MEQENLIQNHQNNYHYYSDDELLISSCKPNSILLYFDFGTVQNNKLSICLKSHGYTHIDNNFVPITGTGIVDYTKLINDSSYSKQIHQQLDNLKPYGINCLMFLSKLTYCLKTKQKIFTPISHKLTYFLINNNINFDIIFPSRNVKDWILNEYLESEYCTDYIKMIFGEPDSDLCGKLNFDNLSHLYYNIPQMLCNKIMITYPTDIDSEYLKYFNI